MFDCKGFIPKTVVGDGVKTHSWFQYVTNADIPRHVMRQHPSWNPQNEKDAVEIENWARHHQKRDSKIERAIHMFEEQNEQSTGEGDYDDDDDSDDYDNEEMDGDDGSYDYEDDRQ